MAEKAMGVAPPNKALQATDLPSLRYGKSAPELGRWASRMRWFFLLGFLFSMQASAMSLQCEPIEKDLAWVEASAHSRGTEVFIHVPVRHAQLDLRSVSISYGEQVTFELPLWPGEQADKFGVIHLQKSTGRFSVLASYGAGACEHEMKQDFNIGGGNAQPTVQPDGPASGGSAG